MEEWVTELEYRTKIERAGGRLRFTIELRSPWVKLYEKIYSLIFLGKSLGWGGVEYA